MSGMDGACSGKKVHQIYRKCNWIPHGWHKLVWKCYQFIYLETCFKLCHLHMSLSAFRQHLLLLKAWDMTVYSEALWAVVFPWQWLCMNTHPVVWTGVGWGLYGVMPDWYEYSIQKQVEWTHVAQEIQRLTVSALCIPCVHLGNSLISLCWFVGRYHMPVRHGKDKMGSYKLTASCTTAILYFKTGLRFSSCELCVEYLSSKI